VNKEKFSRAVDGRCISLTAPWVRERALQHPGEDIELCKFYENLEGKGIFRIPSGVYSMEDLKDCGRKEQICAYYLARRAVNDASVLVYSYPYLLDPKVASLVSRELSKNCIVVFDEAHNIGIFFSN